MSNFAPKRTSYDTGDRRWLRDMLKSGSHSVTVTSSDVEPDSKGLVKSGTEIEGKGLLLNDLVIKAGEKHLVAVVHAGTVDRRYLPADVDEESFPAIVFINEASA